MFKMFLFLAWLPYAFSQVKHYYHHLINKKMSVLNVKCQIRKKSKFLKETITFRISKIRWYIPFILNRGMLDVRTLINRHFFKSNLWSPGAGFIYFET